MPFRLTSEDDLVIELLQVAGGSKGCGADAISASFSDRIDNHSFSRFDTGTEVIIS